jgi:hypothetical protein
VAGEEPGHHFRLAGFAVDNVKASLMRSNGDLIIVDEAYKMSAYSADKKHSLARSARPCPK